jgi:hypothetical protein
MNFLNIEGRSVAVVAAVVCVAGLRLLSWRRKSAAGKFLHLAAGH